MGKGNAVRLCTVLYFLGEEEVDMLLIECDIVRGR